MHSNPDTSSFYTTLSSSCFCWLYDENMNNEKEKIRMGVISWFYKYIVGSDTRTIVQNHLSKSKK